MHSKVDEKKWVSNGNEDGNSLKESDKSDVQGALKSTAVTHTTQKAIQTLTLTSNKLGG